MRSLRGFLREARLLRFQRRRQICASAFGSSRQRERHAAFSLMVTSSYSSVITRHLQREIPDSMTQSPNKSPEPTAVGACSSAVAVHVTSRRWLSFFRWHHSRMTKRARISIIVFLGIFLVAAIVLVPAFIRARSTSAVISCNNNLQQIYSAKTQWAFEHQKTSQDIPTWDDIRPYLHLPSNSIPTCPDGGTYTLGPVGESPQCSLGDQKKNPETYWRHSIP